MEKILKGEEAKMICEEILDHFYVDETYHVHIGAKGYFQDKALNGNNIIVAFDNTSGDCWIEQFDNVQSAYRWLIT